MSLINKLLLSTSIFFISSTHTSEEPKKTLTTTATQRTFSSHGQKGHYHQKDLTTTIHNNFIQSQQAYIDGDYKKAAALAAGAHEYSHVMNISPFNQKTLENINFIIAHSHLILKTPHQALSAFKKIHDVRTNFGIITSEEIAKELTAKAITLSTTNATLSKKLTDEASHFKTIHNTINLNYALASYTKEYEHLSTDELAGKLRITRDPKKLTALMFYMQKQADHNDMRALCIMTTAYNTGQYETDMCQEKALNYAYRYVQLLAQNPKKTPLEQFSIQKTLTENATNKNHPGYIPYLYYSYIQAKRTNNEPVMLASFNYMKNMTDIQSPLRTVIMDIIHDTQSSSVSIMQHITELEKNKSFESIVSSFIQYDSPYASQLLAEKLTTDTPHTPVIHYILGLLSFYQKDYKSAQLHFEISNQNNTDLLTEYRIFNSNRMINPLEYTDEIAWLIDFSKKFTSTSKKTSRNKFAYSLLCNELTSIGLPSINRLFNKKNYDLASTLLLELLHNKNTTSSVIEFLQHAQNTLLQSNNEDNHYALPTIYASRMYTALNAECAKKHSSTTYIALAQLLLPSLDNQTISPKEKQIISKNIELCLQTTEKHKDFANTLRQKIASLYCQLGKKLTNKKHIDQAIHHGNLDAYYEKAVMFFMTKPRTKKLETDALNFLKKHAESNSPTRGKSLSALGQVYFNYNLQDNLLFHTPCDNTQALHYLKAAAKLNNTDAIGLLGILYTKGIKNNDEWVLKPNNDKALLYFSQQSIVPIKSMPEVMYERGKMYYNNQLFGLALKDFGTLALTEVPNNIEAEVALYKMAIKLKMPIQEDMHIQALAHLFQALELDCNNFSFIDDTIQAILNKKINDIIDNNKKSPIDHSWCHSVGNLYLKMPHNTTAEKKRYSSGITYLQYAADHGCHLSQFYLGCLPKTDLPSTKSITYLLQAYSYVCTKRIEQFQSIISEQIKQSLPDNILDHYFLIADFCRENDDDATLHYISAMFEFAPIVLNLRVSKECTDEAIRSSSENSILKKLTDKFMQHPKTSTFAERNAAITLGLIYSYSTEKSDLLKSAYYLQNIIALPQYKSLSIYLAIPYYKLGEHFRKENIPTLALEYFKKSANNGGLDAINYLAHEWLNNNPIMHTIPEDQIECWLRTAITAYSDETSKKLLCNYVKKTSKVAQRDFYSTTASKEMAHPHLPFLIDKESSIYSKDKTYQKGVSLYGINTQEAIKTLQTTTQKRPHPHGSLMIAMHFSENKQLFQEYLTKSFTYGITKKSSQHSVFVDYNLLAAITSFIEHFIASKHNNAEAIKTIITTLIKNIADKGINMTYFNKFVLDTRNIDLSNYQ